MGPPGLGSVRGLGVSFTTSVRHAQADQAQELLLAGSCENHLQRWASQQSPVDTEAGSLHSSQVNAWPHARRRMGTLNTALRAASGPVPRCLLMARGKCLRQSSGDQMALQFLDSKLDLVRNLPGILWWVGICVQCVCM